MSDVLAKAELLAVDTYMMATEDDLGVGADKLLANFISLFPGFTDHERGMVMMAVTPVLRELVATGRLSVIYLSIAYATAIHGVLNVRKVSRQQGH